LKYPKNVIILANARATFPSARRREIIGNAFGIVIKTAEIMADFNKPWFIAGGWAIDLHLDQVTRPHDDVEIAIFRRDQLDIQSYLSGWVLEKVVPGPTPDRQEWKTGEEITPPIHEIHAFRGNDSTEELEILLNESAGKSWVYRRNSEIVYPLSKIGRLSSEGIPYLCPEVALLFKAKKPGPKDEADFYRTYPTLNRESRMWLRDSIRTCHPEHPWLTILS
jgi:hypothetical protein